MRFSVHSQFIEKSMSRLICLLLEFVLEIISQHTNGSQEGDFQIGVWSSGPNGDTLPDFTEVRVRSEVTDLPILLAEPPVIRLGQSLALGVLITPVRKC